MAIFLTGGGEQENFQQLDRRFIEELEKDAQILVIPAAADPEEYDDVLERVESCFSGKKVSHIELCQDVSKLDPAQLEDYSVVFLEGGNTFQLIQAVRQCPFFSSLISFEKNGGTIYADSAGAIVLGTSVKTAFLGDEADEDHEKLQDYRGLALIDWSIHCHYEEHEHQQIQDLMYESGSPVLALAEPCGIRINGDTCEVLGHHPLEIFTFTRVEQVRPGTEFSLKEVQES